MTTLKLKLKTKCCSKSPFTRFELEKMKDPEVLNLRDKRRVLKEKKHSRDEARAQYQDVQQEVRKDLRADKEEWIGEQCSAIEKSIISDDSKKAYNILKSITKTSQLRTAVVDDKKGKILTEWKF